MVWHSLESLAMHFKNDLSQARNLNAVPKTSSYKMSLPFSYCQIAGERAVQKIIFGITQ